MRIGLLTHPYAIKAVHVCEALSTAGLRPALMIYEMPRESRLRFYASKVRARLRRLTQPRVAQAQGVPVAAEYARLHDIEAVATNDLNDERFIAELTTRSIDLFIHGGAGILRAPLLRVPRLGTINAHMGLLPAYRGMNVAEWAALNGDAVGCSVHLIDPGIDTGAIIATREVSIRDAGSIAELRARVNAAQLQLLAGVVSETVQTGKLPRSRHQAQSEGRQYFTMHAELRAVLERRLRETAASQQASR